MSLLLKALKRLDTPHVAVLAPARGPVNLSFEADPTLWDAELPTTDERLPALSSDALQDAVLWPEEISALSLDEAQFRAEIDVLSAPVDVIGDSKAVSILEADAALSVYEPVAEEPALDDGPATIPFVAPSDEAISSDSDVAILSPDDLPGVGEAPPPVVIDDSPQDAAIQSLPASLPDEPPPPLVFRIAATAESDDLRRDHDALGARLSELRMQGLCENMASQIAAVEHPVVLLAPVLPLTELDALVADLAKQFEARSGEPPRVIDLGTRHEAASINPILQLANARLESSLVMLTADSSASLSLAAWLPSCDAVYLVIDVPATPRRAVYEAIEQLARHESRLAGCILLDAA